MNDFISPAYLRSAIRRNAESDDTILAVLGSNLDLVDSNGRTPIFHAILANRLSLVEKLLSLGAATSHQDEEGRTPLHFAVYGRHLDLAKILLRFGAEVDQKDLHGNTPLWDAVMQFKDFKEMIRLLVDSGADPDSKNHYDRSPRDLVLSQKTGDAAEWLDR